MRLAAIGSERAQASIWIIIMMFFGVISVLAVLGLVSQTTSLAGRQSEAIAANYAADAGIEAVLADLQQGTDPLKPGCVVPSPTLNDRLAEVTVQPASIFPSLRTPHRYVDPGATSGLKKLNPDEVWTFTFDAAHGDGVVAYWSFQPQDGVWELTLYEGVDTTGPVLLQTSGIGTPGLLEAAPSSIVGGTYTVAFHNTHDKFLGSDQYSDTGDDNSTWVRIKIFADYLITSDTVEVSLRSYARQFPGPAFPSEQQVVIVQSWEEGIVDELAVGVATPTPVPPTPTPVPPTATPGLGVVAQDDFESGALDGGSGWNEASWTESEDVQVVAAGTPHGGNKHARLRRATGYIARSVDLSAYTGATLEVWAKAESFEGSEYAQLLVSSDGTNWTVVHTWEVADADGVYRLVEVDLAPYGLSSTFWVAVDAEMGNTADRLYVDDAQVVSTS